MHGKHIAVHVKQYICIFALYIKHIMERLREKLYQKINDAELRIVREFIDTVDWSNRMIGITEGRGCGVWLRK